MSDAPLSDRPLRVGINLLFLGARGGGVGRYARELPGALLDAEPETEIHVFLARNAPSDLAAEPWAERVRLTRAPLDVASRGLQAGQYLGLPALAAARRLDVLHSPANAGPVLTPGVASVVSIMDAIWLHRPGDWEPDARAQRALRRLVTHSLRHADGVLAISQASADDLARSFGLAAGRITVTPLGVRVSEAAAVPEGILRAQLGLGRARVLLCVAQKRPYKNLQGLIRALPALSRDVTAVLVGSSTPHEAELRRLAGDLGVADRVRMTDWVSEAELEGLYAVSEGFVLPSLIEGFGLPVLEAMARGVPVACSEIPALSEVAGDAALRFDPADQGAIDRALRRLLADGDLRRDLVARGLERAAHFSWSRTGAGSLRAYREAIARRGGRGG